MTFVAFNPAKLSFDQVDFMLTSCRSEAIVTCTGYHIACVIIPLRPPSSNITDWPTDLDHTMLANNGMSRCLGQGRGSHRLHTEPLVLRAAQQQPGPSGNSSPRAQQCSDNALGSQQQRQQLHTAVIATAVCCAFVSNVGLARAASENWMPRRHHRHIGERFTDTWADSIVEVRKQRC